MPVYDYECKNCSNKLYDVEQSVKDPPLVKCSQCRKKSLERVIFPPTVFVRQEATTVGQLSERNAKKLGRSEVQERTLKDKDSKKTALKEAKKEMYSKINKMTASQKTRFIEDG